MDGGSKKPRHIQKLDEVVVNRIAAGEVIQRPANALKELMENSLDAGSTSIQITVKDGGLKLLKIQDNGTGINKEDFAIVCERFTTSKLEKFDDLTSIGTHGFRGEALASVSHVARLTIITKTVDMQCAFKCQYSDGKLVGAPKPCAGTQGTQIIVEDLFYNVQTRKNALKSTSEEYNRIIEVVTRFAIHNAGVGFCLKKLNDNSNDVRTPVNSTPVENIRLLYGNQIARELIKLEVEDSTHKFKASGLISNLNYDGSKFIMLLFINHRLVESPLLKKALDSVYSTYLAKGKHPFVYLSMEIAPQNVDVNVHPTKHEVHFLHEDAIIHKIQTAADILLKGASTSRSFTVQTLIPKNPAPLVDKSSTASVSNVSKVYDKDLVRTDGRTQKIDKFLSSSAVESSTFESLDRSDLRSTTSSNLMQTAVQRLEDQPKPKSVQQPAQQLSTNRSKSYSPAVETSFLRSTDRSAKGATASTSTAAGALAGRRNFELTSLLQLREAVGKNIDQVLRETFRNSSFVGCVSPKHSLIQYQTKLYVINMERVAEEFFYQLMLNEFGNFGFITLSNPAPLDAIAMMALDDADNEWRPEDGPKDQLSQQIRRLLTSKSEMLDDYFSLQIDEQSNLQSIPMLLHDYIPDLMQLPSYILRLATDVDWNCEKECFDTLCRELARFYKHPNKTAIGTEKDWKWTVEHVLYPAIKATLLPPKSWIDNGTILQIADLPDLYKVFERC